MRRMWSGRALAELRGCWLQPPMVVHLGGDRSVMVMDLGEGIGVLVSTFGEGYTIVKPGSLANGFRDCMRAASKKYGGWSWK